MEMTSEIDDVSATPDVSLPEALTEAKGAVMQPVDQNRVFRAETSDPIDGVLRAFHGLQAQSAHVSALIATSIGIGATDLRALLFIASSAGVTPKRTGDYLDLSSGAITNLVDRMVAADLVLRTPNPNDRRSLVLELAPHGSEAVNRVLDFYRRAFGSSATTDQLAAITRTFRMISDSLAKAAAEDVARLQRP